MRFLLICLFPSTLRKIFCTGVWKPDCLSAKWWWKTKVHGAARRKPNKAFWKSGKPARTLEMHTFPILQKFFDSLLRIWDSALELYVLCYLMTNSDHHDNLVEIYFFRMYPNPKSLVERERFTDGRKVIRLFAGSLWFRSHR